MTAIRVENLSKVYKLYDSKKDRLKEAVNPLKKKYHRDFYALKDISFDVKEGETVGIIGKNGSGKSTLLKLITGLITPTAGIIKVNGKVSALLELGAGFNPEYTGIENIYLNGTIMGFTRQEMDAKIEDIVSFADIGDFVNQPVKMYSSGMYVRLAFAVAINVEPDILIIDEALAVGDIRFQNKCYRRLKEIRNSGITVIIVSHGLSEIEAFCEKVIWLDEGHIKAFGEPKNIVRKYINFMTHRLEPVKYNSKQNNLEQIIYQYSICRDNKEDYPWVQIYSTQNTTSAARAQITDIRVFFNGEYASTVIDSTDVFLETDIRIKIFDKILRPLIGVGVFNNLNEPVVHINSHNLLLKPQPLDKDLNVIINCKINLPPLRPGAYLLALGIDDGVPGENLLLSHVYDAWAFQVKASKDGTDQAGYIKLKNAEIHINCEVNE